MRHSMRACFGLFALLTIALAIPPAALAQTSLQRNALAKQLVEEALHREVYGDSGSRDALLHQATEFEPNLAAANWHLGRVKERGKWTDFEVIAQAVKNNSVLKEYRRLREEADDTLAGHLALANWCNENELREQEEAHLWRVLEFTPDHAEARRRLGHIQVNGIWLTADERREQFEQLVAQRQALNKWQPQMRQIAHGLNRRGQTQREAAEAKLRAIDTPDAIGAMEAEICPLGAEASQIVAEVIAAMQQHEASLALARHAVFSPHPTVREYACEQLQARRKHTYVPALLAELQTPVVSRSQIYRGRGGSLVCRQVMAREGQDRRDLAVLETEYQRIARIGGDRNETLSRALADLQQTQIMRDAAISLENSQTMAMNTRVMQVLESATGEILPPTPQDWWQWWNDENEVFVATDKAVRQIYQRDEVAVADRPTFPTGDTSTNGDNPSGPPVFSVPRTPRTCDCLAAGTRVWTDIGPLAIEQIQVGDRVLAQDAETGELAYKPVLGTTIRPASQLVRIEAGQDAITTSGGHLYWTSGSGWQKARELASGGELHSVRGTVRISGVAEAEFAPTYNLIVADFHTYFVGSSLVLCHDNTISEPTNALVPGLSSY